MKLNKIIFTLSALFSQFALAEQIAVRYTDSPDKVEIRLLDKSLEVGGCPGMTGERLVQVWYRSPIDKMMAPWGEGCWIPIEDNWIKILVRQYDGDGVYKPMQLDATQFKKLPAFKAKYFEPVPQ